MFNTIHACALKHFSNDQTTKFICCLEANDQAGLKCSQEAGIDFKVVRNCSEGKEGLKLLYELGLKTNKLVPKHEFVPWVLLNGKYDKKEMTEILNNQDLMLVLCRHIQDPKPEVCNAVF
jgi:interferon gamma-inducible protein 30